MNENPTDIIRDIPAFNDPSKPYYIPRATVDYLAERLAVAVRDLRAPDGKRVLVRPHLTKVIDATFKAMAEVTGVQIEWLDDSIDLSSPGLVPIFEMLTRGVLPKSEEP